MADFYLGTDGIRTENKVHNLDACIKCGACSAQCPVSSVNPLFPGPKQAGPDAERLRLEGVGFAAEVLELCSNCKTCEVTCLSGVKVSEMILSARIKARARGELKENWRQRLRAEVLGRAEQLGRMGTVWPALANALLGRAWIRYLLELGLGISGKAPLPFYRKRFDSAVVGDTRLQTSAAKDLVYFPGCFTTHNDPATAEAVVRVLQHNGYKVIVPPLKCCGVPLAANGRFAAADKKSRYNLRVLLPYLNNGLPVITACTSCGLALKQDYPRIDAPGADLIGRQTYDLFEFLWALHEEGKLREEFQQVDVRCGYHAPCHLKSQGIGTPSLRLLRLIPGVRMQDIDAGCCGLSGSYGFKLEKYEMAMQIGSSLFAKVQHGLNNGEFNEISTECGVCSTQIIHGTGASCYHPVRILASAYGLESN